jgi:hypothetical protein
MLHASKIPEVIERTVIRPQAEILAASMARACGRKIAVNSVHFDPQTNQGEIELEMLNYGEQDVLAILQQATAQPDPRLGLASQPHG